MRTNTFFARKLTALLLCAAMIASLAVTALAYGDSGGEGTQAITIRITPPQGTAEGSAPVEVRITDSAGEGFQAAQVKIGGGNWSDITGDLEQTENRYYYVADITENCTVYVQVTGRDGKIYEKSEYIQCFDTASDARSPSDAAPADTPAASGSEGAAAPSNPSTALTPNGQGTVADHVTDEDGKEFFTFTTPNDNTFYLIVDRERNSENVYFLNAVTESDLLALAEKDGDSGSTSAVPDPAPAPVCTCGEKCIPGQVDTRCPVCVLSLKDCTGRDTGGEEQPEQPKESGGTAGMAIIFLAVLITGGAGYYLKIYRPKHELDSAEDFDDLTGGGEETVNEDDPDEPRGSDGEDAAGDTGYFTDYGDNDEPQEPWEDGE